MALSGSRLTTALAADILSQLQTLFPVNASLLSAEKTAYATGQTNLANALANAAGPDVVSEVTGHASVNPGSFSNSGGSVTGTGTVS
jgi:hypothetical protein